MTRIGKSKGVLKKEAQELLLNLGRGKMFWKTKRKKLYKKSDRKETRIVKKKYMQRTCRNLPLSQRGLDKILQKRTTNAELTIDFTEEASLCSYSTLTDKKKASFLNSYAALDLINSHTKERIP